MSDVLIASLFGLAVAFSWGCGSWLLARNSRKAPSLEINLSIQIPSFIIAIFLLIFANPDLSNSKHILLIVLAHIIYGITYLLFIKALSLGPTGVVIPLQAIFPVYVLLFSIGLFLVGKIIKYDQKYLLLSTLKIIISCLLMGLVVMALKNNLHFIFVIPLGALVYAAALYLIKVFTKNDLIQLKDLLLKKA